MSVADEEVEMEEQAEQQPEDSCDSGKNVFKVTCGALSGTLHVRRFASGNYSSPHARKLNRLKSAKHVSFKLTITTRDSWEKYSY